jgi:hypothetical protein
VLLLDWLTRRKPGVCGGETDPRPGRVEIRHAFKRKGAELDARPEGLRDVDEAGDGGLRQAAPWITSVFLCGATGRGKYPVLGPIHADRYVVGDDRKMRGTVSSQRYILPMQPYACGDALGSRGRGNPITTSETSHGDDYVLYEHY